MDGRTTEIRYQQWVEVLQDWSNSGLSKRNYCQQNGINEKKFYYYQRRIRSYIAGQAEQQLLTDGNSGILASHGAGHPRIVKLKIPGTTGNSNNNMISFSVNGMSISVPENISSSFLAKLLEAACHGAR